MKTTNTWIFGLAALGLALAAPVQAAPNDLDGFIMLAKNDKGNESRYDREDNRKSKQPDKKGSSKYEADDREPQGYGYGYERRQMERNEEENRSRGRR